MRVVAVPIFLVAMCLMVLLPTEVVAYILLCVGGPAPLQVAPAFSEVLAGLAHVSNRIGRLLRSLAPHAIFHLGSTAGDCHRVYSARGFVLLAIVLHCGRDTFSELAWLRCWDSYIY